jgi:hypothetical protein
METKELGSITKRALRFTLKPQAIAVGALMILVSPAMEAVMTGTAIFESLRKIVSNLSQFAGSSIAPVLVLLLALYTIAYEVHQIREELKNEKAHLLVAKSALTEQRAELDRHSASIAGSIAREFHVAVAPLVNLGIASGPVVALTQALSAFFSLQHVLKMYSDSVLGNSIHVSLVERLHERAVESMRVLCTFTDHPVPELPHRPRMNAREVERKSPLDAITEPDYVQWHRRVIEMLQQRQYEVASTLSDKSTELAGKYSLAANLAEFPRN